MAKKQLRQLTQERFQEEVAKELGIDLNSADQARAPAVDLERKQGDASDRSTVE